MAIALSLWQAGPLLPDRFNSGGLPLLGRFWAASLHPDLSPEFLQLTLQATFTTLTYAICGTCLSLLLGIIGGLFTAQIWWLMVWPHWPLRQPLWMLLRGLLAIPRAIHEMVWGLVFLNLWGLDPLTAIVSLALPSGAIVAKVFAEILDETPRAPAIALLNNGTAPLPALLYGLMPSALANLLSYTLYRFECALRTATILGMIGVGGLGTEILLSLQSLRYEQLWTLFYGLIGLNGAVEVGSVFLRRRLNVGVGMGFMGVSLVGFWALGANFSRLGSPQTVHQLASLLQSLWPPRWAAISISQLLSLSAQTLAMSILASVGAGVGALLLSGAAARNRVLGSDLNRCAHPLSRAGLQGWGLLVVSRTVLLCCRAIPAPVWALVTLFVIFPGIWPGAIALGIHNLGVLGRLLAETRENLDPAPLNALKAQGASGPAIFLYGMLPLGWPQFLAYGFYRWEVCIRETVTVGLVGAGGLGLLLTEQLSSFDYASVVITLSGFVLLTIGVDRISAAIRRRPRVGTL